MYKIDAPGWPSMISCNTHILRCGELNNHLQCKPVWVVQLLNVNRGGESTC
jgi:hypothetical protein